MLSPIMIGIGRNVKIGTHVFINHGFNDLGTLICRKIHIVKKVWIGANALILPVEMGQW